MIREEPEPWKQSTLPGVLGKACDDKLWAYAAELKSGRIYIFDGADDLGDGWVHFREWTGDYNDPCSMAALYTSQPHEVPERGMTVAVSEIRWIAEARG